MGVIVDSSVFIAAERGRFDLVAFLSAFANERFQIAAITASELLHGCERAIDPIIRERRKRFVEGILQDFAVVPFTLAEAREHARLWAALEIAGQTIGPRDQEIAATARSHGYAVATRNMREFLRVPSLKLLDLGPFDLAR
jgi:tRNA(fMet)-specific endonuclease VapC